MAKPTGKAPYASPASGGSFSYGLDSAPSLGGSDVTVVYDDQAAVEASAAAKPRSGAEPGDATASCAAAAAYARGLGKSGSNNPSNYAASVDNADFTKDGRSAEAIG